MGFYVNGETPEKRCYAVGTPEPLRYALFLLQFPTSIFCRKTLESGEPR
jgi:hypothetical protein